MAYIKKEPIVEFITKGLNNPDKTKAYGYDAIEILTEIEYAPEADVVEVKHARWVQTSALVNPYCSDCKCYNDRQTTFCHSCGARMDGGGKSEH